MLAGHCPRHGRTVLITAALIRGIDTTERAHVVRWRCPCGALGSTSVARHRRSP